MQRAHARITPPPRRTARWLQVSPCINPNFMNGKTMAECTSHTECSSSIVQWALSGFASMQTKTVVGIAKDGHVLYGPYDDGAKLWETSDVDPCNGAWSDDASDFFFVVSRRPAAFLLVTAMEIFRRPRQC